MPNTIIFYPPTRIEVVGGSEVVDGIETGLTPEDRLAIAAVATDTLIRDWARRAQQTAPMRSRRLVDSIRPIPKRGLEVAFYGPFQAGREPRQRWLAESWQAAIRNAPRAIQQATQQVRPEFEFSLSDSIDRLQNFAGTPVGGFFIDRIQTRAASLAVALVLVRAGG